MVTAVTVTVFCRILGSSEGKHYGSQGKSLYANDYVIRHKKMQFIPEMGWIATFLCLCSIKLAKHLII